MSTGFKSIKQFFVTGKKFILLILLLSIFTAFFYFHLYEYLTLDTIKKYHITAVRLTAEHFSLSISVYILIFTFMVACAIPCATIFTLLGGFLFGLSAIVFSVFSTTVGGMILFLSVRSAIGAHITARSSGWLKDMEDGFQRNAFNYLLTLRLIPVFPCWISNVAAGVFNVPLKTFLTATALGIFPATVIYVLAGRSLVKLLTDEKTPVLYIMMTPSVLFPLLGLAFLSLFPVIYKRIKGSGKR
jgi:uncharacterized membrane protein YdjX (TVP38/TMEM64 family)